jgi:hypothetical protein
MVARAMWLTAPAPAPSDPAGRRGTARGYEVEYHVSVRRRVMTAIAVANSAEEDYPVADERQEGPRRAGALATRTPAPIAVSAGGQRCPRRLRAHRAAHHHLVGGQVPLAACARRHGAAGIPPAPAAGWLMSSVRWSSGRIPAEPARRRDRRLWRPRDLVMIHSPRRRTDRLARPSRQRARSPPAFASAPRSDLCGPARAVRPERVHTALIWRPRSVGAQASATAATTRGGRRRRRISAGDSSFSSCSSA